MAASQLFDLPVRPETEPFDVDQQGFWELGDLLAHFSVGISSTTLLAGVIDRLAPFCGERLFQIECVNIAVLVVVVGGATSLTNDGCSNCYLKDLLKPGQKICFDLGIKLTQFLFYVIK